MTIVGHSLGGGIALSFAYNYPARVHRMALISSGGLGREVHPLLRALSLPGASPALRLLTMRPTLGLLAALARLLREGPRSQAARKGRGASTRAHKGGRSRTTNGDDQDRPTVIGHRGQSVAACLTGSYCATTLPDARVMGNA